MRHFVLCHTAIDVVALVRMFRREVFRLPEVPRTIVSDRGPEFVSTICGQICNQLGIDRQLTIALHAQMDTLPKVMNAGMKQKFRVLGNHQQDDWARWLPLAKFAPYKGRSESTMCTLFFAVHEEDPRTSFEGELSRKFDP
jgi:hypothetical protein